MPFISINKQSIVFNLKRSAKTKRLRLEYSSTGLHIVAPYRLSNQVILDFLWRHKKWIAKHTKKQESTWPFPAVDIILQRAFKMAVRNHIEKYSALIAKRPTGVYLKTQSRRWGSCGIHDCIYINWLLMLAPDKVLQYVVLHECCHLWYRHHGPSFWTLVKKHMPDYQLQTQWLRRYGNQMFSHHSGFIEIQSVFD